METETPSIRDVFMGKPSSTNSNGEVSPIFSDEEFPPLLDGSLLFDVDEFSTSTLIGGVPSMANATVPPPPIVNDNNSTDVEENVKTEPRTVSTPFDVSSPKITKRPSILIRPKPVVAVKLSTISPPIPPPRVDRQPPPLTPKPSVCVEQLLQPVIAVSKTQIGVSTGATLVCATTARSVNSGTRKIVPKITPKVSISRSKSQQITQQRTSLFDVMTSHLGPPNNNNNNNCKALAKLKRIRQPRKFDKSTAVYAEYRKKNNDSVKRSRAKKMSYYKDVEEKYHSMIDEYTLILRSNMEKDLELDRLRTILKAHAIPF